MLQLLEQPLKTFALEKFSKLQLMIKNQSTISKDDREILSNIDVTYEEWGATQQSKKGVRKLIEPV